jgi:hypothetical protein
MRGHLALRKGADRPLTVNPRILRAESAEVCQGAKWSPQHGLSAGERPAESWDLHKKMKSNNTKECQFTRCRWKKLVAERFPQAMNHQCS